MGRLLFNIVTRPDVLNCRKYTLHDHYPLSSEDKQIWRDVFGAGRDTVLNHREKRSKISFDLLVDLIHEMLDFNMIYRSANPAIIP